MAKGKARVLYFINGMTPTPEQLKDAENFGAGVTFRNAIMIRETDPLEHADAVAGDVPAIYAAAYARPSDYANAFSRGAPSGPLPVTQGQTDADVQRMADTVGKASAARQPAPPAPEVPAKGASADPGAGWGAPKL